MYVFISGLFSSGSTLLTRMLSAHPDIFIACQPFFPFFKMWRNKIIIDELRLPFDPETPMGFDYLKTLTGVKPNVYEDFNRVFCDPFFWWDDIHELRESLIKWAKADTIERVQDLNFGKLYPDHATGIFWQLINILKEKTDKKVVGIKESFCEEWFYHLTKWYNIKIIHIIRDPRGVAASRNTGDQFKEIHGGEKYPLSFITESWNRSVEIHKQMMGAYKYFHVKYENLIKFPSLTVDLLCSHLEVPFVHHDMLDPSTYINAKGEPWIPNSASTTNRQFNERPLSYWRDALTHEEIEYIEFICHENMNELGYIPKYPISEKSILNYRDKPEEITPFMKGWGFLGGKNDTL